MEVIDIKDLHGDPMNPRIISTQQYDKLKELLRKFGDLSGVVRNIRTDQLVGGHMRLKAFEESNGSKNIQITQRFDTPTKSGTVAIGYVVVDGESFSYREVDWDQGFQRAANIAANNAGGENDNDKLAEMIYEISQLENGSDLLGLTALADKEIRKLMEASGAVEAAPSSEDNQDDEKNELIFSLTPDQSELVASVLEHIRITKDIPSSDHKAMNGSALYYMAEEYIKHNPMPRPDEFEPPELPPAE